ARPDLGLVAEAVEDIVNQDQHASAVIDRILAMMRPGTHAVVPVDLYELLRTTLEILHSQLVIHHVSVSFVQPTCKPVVRGDAVQLQQVFLNLIINAIDAMEGCAADARQLTVAINEGSDGEVVTEITDSGSGIALNVKERVFEPFVTTKDGGL